MKFIQNVFEVIRTLYFRRLCHYCDKFFHYQSIKKHIEVVHLKIRRFACSSCDFRTAREDRLVKHCQFKHDPTNSYKDKDRK